MCYNDNINTVDIEVIQGDFVGYLWTLKIGEAVLITEFGQPLAELKLLAPVADGATGSQRPYGLAKGEFVVPDDFDAPLPEEILREFEGRGRP